MKINCIEERVKILEHIWNEHHNKKVCNILLNKLTNDIVFFLGVKLPKDLEDRIDKIDKEINE
nr:MAG TPA: hypothetical protein [Caudoviricetes sp.]